MPLVLVMFLIWHQKPKEIIETAQQKEQPTKWKDKEHNGRKYLQTIKKGIKAQNI
jgi:hypothetical protein